MNNWPTDDHITNVAHNGEVQEPTYEMLGNLYRINPAGNYALYWSGKKWKESAMVTNGAIRLYGTIQR